MSRLLTFGCSFVHGWGLPDIYPHEKNSSFPEPSKLSWPTLLAKKLKKECVNFGSPGLGNMAILMKVLSANYEPDDLVIVSFSYFNRYSAHVFVDEDGNSKTVNPKQLEHKRLVLDEIFIPKNVNNYWYNWLAIQHCQLFLASKKISNTSYYGGVLPKFPIRPNMLHIPNFLDTLRMEVKDWAKDKAHPGVESHELHADKLYKVLTE